MRQLRPAILLLFTTPVIAFLTACHKQPSPPPLPPDSLVRSLFTEVVARDPNDIPQGADWNAFAPYLSKSLLQKVKTAQSCAADWNRQNPDITLTARIAGHFEIFTGDAAKPLAFTIGKTEPQKDDSFRVYVTVRARDAWSDASERRVAAIVIPENGHFALDEVIYLDDAIWDHEEDRRNGYLSHYLAAGCDGSRWIGSSLPREPAELAKSLYANVVNHPTTEIPSGETWRIFAPYLSQSLFKEIEIYQACIADEVRQYVARKGPLVKLAMLEDFGIFSGSVEESAPRTVQVEKIEPQKDGTVRVTVKLGLPEYQMEWRVVDLFTQENNRYVLKDVIFPDEIITKGVKDDRPPRPDEYLSRDLTRFCQGGTHWTGNF